MSPLEPSTVATVAAVMVAYLGVLLVIGWQAARRTHGGEDFHLAGRSLGAWSAGISSTASSESGWVTLGAVGMTFVHGVSGLWYAPGCLLGYLVNVYVVAPRLRPLSAAHGSVTLTDVITRRWGDPKNVLRVTATAIILVCMMGYVAAQMTAAGKAFSSSLGLEGRGGYLLGVIIGAIVITVVTSLGGFRAVAWTDLFQGLLVAGALIALPLYAVARLGGFGTLVAGLGAIDPSFLTASGDRVGPALWGFVIGQLGIGLGYPGMPHVITRYMAARDDREVQRLQVIAMAWGLAVFYGAGLVGLVGRVMLPDLADGEQALMALALELVHPVLAGLLLAAVISAVLSTVSSQLLVAASAVSYDIVEETLGRSRDDRRSLLLGRITVAVVGLLGVLVALSEVRLVFWFVLFAWSGLGAAFAPLILLALARRGVNRHGALAAMLTGIGVTVAWKLGRDAA
ncbi:MAG TPA: sodium/proline symporter, partial [Chondromyces sp.]|nr:sodium/proline symporter [Chondromyces sp.]